MRNETRKKFNDFTKQVARFNGVGSATEKFSVEPSVQQKLETKTQESSAFLSMINMVGVDEKSGEKIGLSLGGTIAGRTDTGTKDREPSDVTGLQGQDYDCKKTDFDTALPYRKLDM